MPVVRRGDHHRVDILVLEQLAIIVVFLWRPARLLDREVHVVVAKIAEGDGFVVAMFEERVVHLVAAIAKADVAHPHTIVRPEFASS